MWCIQTPGWTLVRPAEWQQRNFSHFTDTHVSHGCVCTAWGICAAQTCMYTWQTRQPSSVINNHLLVTLKPKTESGSLPVLYSHMLFISCTTATAGQLSSALISTEKLITVHCSDTCGPCTSLFCSAVMQPQCEPPIKFTAILGDLEQHLWVQVCLDHSCSDIQYWIY